MKILSKPKGNAEEYGRWSVNPYIGCSHGCKYCYLKSGPSGAYLGQNKPVLKKGIVNEEHAYHLAMTEIIEHKDEIIRDGGLFFTFTSDPLMRVCRNLNLTIADEAVKWHIPVTFLTKSGIVNTCYSHVATFQEMQMPNPMEDIVGRYVAFGWTLTGQDDLELNAPTNCERIQSMNAFYAAGYRVWASLEPVIDFKASLKMLNYALNAGCQHFKIGLMTKNTKVCRNGFTLDGKVFPPYDTAECLAFVQDVMVATKDRATVYWKQSFRDFVGGTPAHRRFSDEALAKIFDNYPHSVTKDWSMFNQ